jgi:hypothetical protein
MFSQDWDLFLQLKCVNKCKILNMTENYVYLVLGGPVYLVLGGPVYLVLGGPVYYVLGGPVYCF